MRKDGLYNLPLRFQAFELEITVHNTPIFFSLSDKKSVILSPANTVHTLRKIGEIKAMSVLTRLER